MSLAKDVAIELRKLADSLDKHPEVEIARPVVYLSCYTKAEFMHSVQVLPKPLNKKIDNEGKSYDKVQVYFENKSIQVMATVYKSLTCELVEPARAAVYRCVPILSLEEEMEVVG